MLNITIIFEETKLEIAIKIITGVGCPSFTFYPIQRIGIAPSEAIQSSVMCLHIKT